MVRWHNIFGGLTSIASLVFGHGLFRYPGVHCNNPPPESFDRKSSRGVVVQLLWQSKVLLAGGKTAWLSLPFPHRAFTFHGDSWGSMGEGGVQGLGEKTAGRFQGGGGRGLVPRGGEGEGEGGAAGRTTEVEGGDGLVLTEGLRQGPGALLRQAQDCGGAMAGGGISFKGGGDHCGSRARAFLRRMRSSSL